MRITGKDAVYATVLLIGLAAGAVREWWTKIHYEADIHSLEGDVVRLMGDIDDLRRRTARTMYEVERLTRAGRATSDAWEAVYDADVPGHNPYDSADVGPFIRAGKVRPGLRNLFDIPPALRGADDIPRTSRSP